MTKYYEWLYDRLMDAAKSANSYSDSRDAVAKIVVRERDGEDLLMANEHASAVHYCGVGDDVDENRRAQGIVKSVLYQEIIWRLAAWRKYDEEALNRDKGVCYNDFT